MIELLRVLRNYCYIMILLKLYVVSKYWHLKMLHPIWANHFICWQLLTILLNCLRWAINWVKIKMLLWLSLLSILH